MSTGREQKYAHFTEKETEAQRQPVPGPKADEQQSWDENIWLSWLSAESFPSVSSDNNHTGCLLVLWQGGQLRSHLWTCFPLSHQDQRCCVRPICFPLLVLSAFFVLGVFFN